MTANRDDLLNHALAYAEAGWLIFPLRPGSKRPATPNHTAENCDQSDRRCLDGHTGWEARATRDANRITKAWRHRPYGIGIACGPANLLVVDLDTPKKPDQASGTDTLSQIEAEHGQALPATWTIGTPSGGRHLYYQRPKGSRLGNTAGKLGPGIDTRGEGGYVVAPPSTTPTGDYWIVDDHPPAGLPDWFAHLLAPPARIATATGRKGSPLRPQGDIAERYAANAIRGELDRIAAAPEGQRNHTLFCASIALGQLAATGLILLDEAREELLCAADGHVGAGAYSHHQAKQTIASGLRRGVNEPRQIPSLSGARR